MLGELALRLQHKVRPLPPPCPRLLTGQEEAEDAFHACLETGFSAKAWRNLLPLYSSRNQTSQALACIAKLVAWNLRWYSEFSPDLVRAFREVVETEGVTKVRSLLSASAGNVVDLMRWLFNLVETFEMAGWDM
jgi:Chs5-Arf1p-binding protein BUD7/BCH1